jgi:hypothetical protein
VRPVNQSLPSNLLRCPAQGCEHTRLRAECNANQ